MANDMVMHGGGELPSPGKVAAYALGGAAVAGTVAASFWLSSLWLKLALGAIGLGVIAGVAVRAGVGNAVARS